MLKTVNLVKRVGNLLLIPKNMEEAMKTPPSVLYDRGMENIMKVSTLSEKSLLDVVLKLLC